MTTLSKLSFQDEDMGYAKRNKCHAQESMMKKKSVGHMKVQSIYKKRKRVGHMNVQEFKKREREREKIAHVQRERERESS